MNEKYPRARGRQSSRQSSTRYLIVITARKMLFRDQFLATK